MRRENAAGLLPGRRGSLGGFALALLGFKPCEGAISGFASRMDKRELKMRLLRLGCELTASGRAATLT